MKQIIEKEIHRRILLNPGPATTSIRVKEALVVEDICPREQDFAAVLNSVRKKAVAIVGGEDSHRCILLGSSGTGAMEACLSSVVDKNDSILIIENGAYGARMVQICQALDINHEVLKFSWGDEIDLALVENKLKDGDSGFKAIAFIHHETTTGILNPLSQLTKMAKQHNLLCVVDAMSSYAGIPINVAQERIDFLISSSNKCIQGMAGLGIIIAANEALEKIRTIKSKSFYFDLYKNYDSQEFKGQFLYTPPVQILYSLDAAFDELHEEGGVIERAKRYASLYTRMFDGMTTLGFEPMLKNELNSGILTTFIEPNHKNYSFSKMHSYLYERGVTIYPGKVSERPTFRISNLGDLNRQDIDVFLDLIEQYLKENEIQLK